MRTTIKLFAALLLSAMVLLAQAQRGGGAVHSFGHTGNGSATADSRRALAFQVTDGQHDALAHCMAATEAARELGRSVGDNTYWNSWRYRHVGYDFNAVYRKKDQLQLALADMTASHQQFLHVLSEEQVTELRANLNSLDRLQGKLSLQIYQLDDELTAAKPDSFRVSTRLYGMGKTIDKWYSQHKKIAKEMSLPR